MKFSFTFVIITALLSLSACSSLHSKLRKSQIGMFKKQALRKFGEPVEKYRTEGRDHWVYETQKRARNSNKELLVYQHILVFEEGVLIDNKIKRSFSEKELKDFYKKP